MDGTRLFYTTTLPPLPEDVVRSKSLWGTIAIPLLAVFVLTAVVFILYRASPRLLNSPARNQPSKPGGQPMPPAAKDTKLPPTPVAPPPATTNTTETSVDPFAQPTLSTTKSNGPAAPKSSPSPAAMQTPKPVSHVLVAPDLRPVATSNEPKNQTGSNQPSAMSGVATANQAPGNDQKSAASSYSTSSHPRPPARQSESGFKVQLVHQESRPRDQEAIRELG
jgi:outer membrane biosynthesis protein TonB